MAGCPSSIHSSILRLCVQKLASIPAVASQNVTSKSCLVCAMSEKYSFWVTLSLQSDQCNWGEAEVRIFDFKTTWSEFQKASQTATEQGKVEQWIFDFKTTWSEFRKTCQTDVMRGKAELRIYNLKKTSPPQSRSQAVVCVSTPRMYPRSGYFLVMLYFSPKIQVWHYWAF